MKKYLGSVQKPIGYECVRVFVPQITFVRDFGLPVLLAENYAVPIIHGLD